MEFLIGFFNSNIPYIVIGMLMVAVYIIISKNIKNNYKKILEDIKEKINSGSLDFENTYIKNMYDEFTESLNGNIANINTQVIIEKNLNNYADKTKIFNLSIRRWEFILEYMPSLATTLGLLGTFWGLTGAIQSTSSVLSSNSGLDGNTMELLKKPISDMGLAFGTSIVGIGVSIIINLLLSKEYKYMKQEIIDEIENCFDNIMSKNDGPDYNEKIESFISRMEIALTSMAETVSTSICNGMDNLVNKVNGVGDEIRISSKNLTDSMNLLDKFVRNFEVGAMKFNEAVDRYELVCNTASSKLQEVNVALVESVDSYKEYFSENILYFERSKDIFEKSIKEVLEDNKAYFVQAVKSNEDIIKLNNENITKIIESNKEHMNSVIKSNEEHLNTNIEHIKDTFEKLDKSVNTTYENLDRAVYNINDMMNEIKSTMEKNSEFIEKNSSKMENTNDKLSLVVSDLGENIKDISDVVGASMSNNMQDAVEDILNKMNLEFNNIFKELKESILILKENSILQKDTIQSIIEEQSQMNEMILNTKRNSSIEELATSEE